MKQIIFILSALLVTAGAEAQLQPGNLAPEISLADNRDSAFNLSSLRGKIVLVDFWASWCVPCRAANPGVVRLYNKYKGQGFEVVGVSIDSKKGAWLSAIKKDRITYRQVNDPKGWYSKTAESYFVDEIPATFLLDKEGKLVAVNLEGRELERKVKELLKN
jgi:thiol-disulfide isomerase/thioredoxin